MNAIPGKGVGAEWLGRLSPYLRHCGDSHRPPWRIDARCLLDYLLVYIAGGNGRFSLDGREAAVGPGDLFWVPPGHPHAMESREPMHCIYMHFDLLYRPAVSHWDFSIPGGMVDLGELLPLMHPPLEVPEIDVLGGRIRAANNGRVGRLLQELCLEASRAQPYTVLRTSGMILEMVAEILRGCFGDVQVHEHLSALEEAAEILRREHSGDPSVEELARRVHLSPAYFRRLFARHYGVSPRTYLQRLRIDRAKMLMMEGVLNLSEIARQVGFGSLSSFSRSFKKLEGIAPGAYACRGEVPCRVENRRTPYSH